jgi:hypothetical protein
VNASQEGTPTITRKQLKTAAYNSLWRLKRAIEKDGFYSARVALNVWRSNAVDAGLFDQAQYDEFRRQIYEKSIENSLTCFEASILSGNYKDAKICLHTWKLRTQTLGTYNQEYYDQMKNRLESAVSQQIVTGKE